jgi:2-amino-4-hydroxy-6-hydroxymethyldihydropteridine diphosphokinase
MTPLNTPNIVEVGLGLGGNVGDSRAKIRAALDALRERNVVEVTAVSSLYRTAPWGPVAQDDFANACAIGTTRLSPLELLDAVKTIERDLGRVETVRWGPREIDIDILYYGDDAFDDPRLILPHKELFQRAFVLQPLAEIAPDRTVGGRRVIDAAREVGAADVRLWGEE